MGMTKPVTTHRLADSGLFRSFPNNPPDLRWVQTASFAATEHRGVIAGTISQGDNYQPDRCRNQDRVRLSALAEDGELSTLVSVLAISPSQLATLGYANGGGIQQRQHGPISGVLFQCQHPLDFTFCQDPLAEFVAESWQPQRASRIKRQIAQTMGKGEEALE